MATVNYLFTNILQNIFFWVNVSHWLPHFFHIMEVNGYCQLFGYPHSSKYLLFGWWYPLNSTVFLSISWKSMATVNFLVTHILQNIFFWVNVSHWLPHFFHIMEVNGYRQLFGYPYSSKYLIFGWWYPLTSTFFFSISWKLMATDNFLVTHILQNIFFWVQQKKNSYRFAITWGWVNDDRIVILAELSL